MRTESAAFFMGRVQYLLVEFCGKKRVLLRHYRLEKRDEKRV